MAEAKTGYVNVHKDSDEHCHNCAQFVSFEQGCKGPKMKLLSIRPRLPNGDVEVRPTGHCNFWKEETK